MPQLRHYQKKGARLMELRGGRVLLADEMGLGKTIQALAFLQRNKHLRPAVIISPATVKQNWVNEAHQWLTKDQQHLYVISGRPTKAGLMPHCVNTAKGGPVIIINYDLMVDRIENRFFISTWSPLFFSHEKIKFSGWANYLRSIHPKIVILDECQYIKNWKSARSKATKRLIKWKSVQSVIAISGTPIINKPIEFYDVINLIDPTLFPSRKLFKDRYCGPTKNEFATRGFSYNGATHTRELNRKLIDSIMIRRKKEDVLKDLPAKTRTVIPVDIDNRAEYRNANTNLIQWIKEEHGKAAANKAKNAEALVRFEKLKQLAVEGKMKTALTWIEDFLDSGEKLCVFATHKKVIDAVVSHFKKIGVVKITGETPSAQRQEAVDKFQNNPNCKLFVGNIKAAGVGITLTAASNSVFLELDWTPAAHDQAEDRIHRIGQKSACNIWYLLAEDTVEGEIATLLDKKRRVLNAVLDGEITEESGILSELLTNFKTREK